MKNKKQEKIGKPYTAYIENGYVVIENEEEYEKEYPPMYPIVEKIGEDLFRTTIPEVGDVFTGNASDTLNILSSKYDNVYFNKDKFILDNCEQLSLEDFLEFLRKAGAMLEKMSKGKDVCYRCENKIFLCKSDKDIDMLIYEAMNNQIYYGDKSIKWEKRNNKNI